MTVSTNKHFNYESKCWGNAPITNFSTDFQGLELYWLLRDGIESSKITPVKQAGSFQSAQKSKFYREDFLALDMGCGGGNVCAFLAKRFAQWKITGIDISKEAIGMAKKRFKGIEFLVSSAESIQKPSASYDLITSFDTLEHFADLDAVLSEVCRLLKPGGVFCVGVPLEREFPTIYWLLYVFGWRGKKHFSGHVNFFTDKSLEERIAKYGFVLRKKRFSFHLIFSLFDVGYYFLQSISGRQFAFETTVSEMQPSLKQSLLIWFKRTISWIGYVESRLLWRLPGGKGHFIFVKKENDFFSDNPPVTLLEDLQMQVGFEKAIQPRDITFVQLLKRLKVDNPKQVMDFGCANGIWLERFLVDYPKSKGLGVDISQRLIGFASERKGKKGNYVCSMDTWQIPKNQFDFVFSFDTFEHVVDKKKELLRIYESLKPGGKFLFYTLNPRNAFTFDWLFEKFGSNYLYRRADHEKSRYYDPDVFKQDLVQAGMHRVQFILYDGPVNIFWHVFCYAYLGFLERVCRSLRMEFLLSPALWLNDRWLRLIYPLNSLVDSMFFRTGNSNGYFIWGEKRMTDVRHKI